jgi:hypothetical protein
MLAALANVSKGIRVIDLHDKTVKGDGKARWKPLDFRDAGA